MGDSNKARSERARIRRLPIRADYDRRTIDTILDSGMIGHVAFIANESPALVPMLYARVGDEVILHGSNASRAMRSLVSGEEFCFSVTHFDGLVLARSAFHHTANYRSVVLHGRARSILEPGEKRAALDALVERVIPGRLADVRGPSDKELAATAVAALPVDEAAAKIRNAGPVDDRADLEIPAWCGVLPLALGAGPPIAAEDLDASIERPGYVDEWVALRRG